ncbi:PWWP domain-containing protein isoform 2 [Cladophialophora immunda]|nr:PWWP domain-containing protein isoform 2 [Cladophialophora immunda]
MASEESAPTTEVPVKVPQPADGAPPSLAEPASGTVAEMSGALPAEKSTETEPVQNTGILDAFVIQEIHADLNLIGTATANGPVETVSEPPKEPQEPVTEPEAVAPTAEDTETKETDDAETAQPETNGAAPADKKSSSRRKSSTAPDHKSKKLNKKKSMSKITHLDAQPGDYYLARLKGYPPWPSIIADEDMLPDIMINTRPVTTKKDDGTYNEAYADGGKKMNERTFPIMFLGTNEFVWIHNTDLAPLTPEDCKDVTEKGKAKALLAAYKVAAEGHDLQFFKTMLDEHAAALQADIDAKEAREAEKVAKAEKKKKRKSEAKAEADDAEMEDADADVEPKKSSKKRKKEVDEDEDEDEKPAKTPKTTKIKLTTNKTPKTEEKKPKEKATKARSEKRKSRAAQEDEEMADAVEPEPEEKPLDPVEARKAREKEGGHSATQTFAH